MKKGKNLLLLMICAVVFLTFAVGSSSGASTSSNSDGDSTGDTHELKTYKVGEDIYITNNKGKYRVKITSVEETNYRNTYADSKPKKVVIIKWEYENISIDDDLSVDEIFNFKLYDNNNNKLETYPGDRKYGDSVSKGRKSNASCAFGLNSDEKYIELEYYDNFLNSKPDCKVILEW